MATYAMMAFPTENVMPAIEATEYERFGFDEAGQNALTLDEAVKKAKDLRKKDTANFYRVEWADESHTTFAVKKVPVASVYANFLSKITKMMTQYALQARSK